MENSNSTSSPRVNDDKLSGQLIIKAQLGDDIRKMMIHNEDLTLNELILMMERIFVGKISNSDEITIKYLDDDGDKITLSNDSDLNVALHFHKVLRLFVFVNGRESTNTKSEEQIPQQGNFVDEKAFRTELQDIRTTVQTILDRLQLSTNDNSTVSSNLNQESDSTQQQQNCIHSDNNQSQSNHDQQATINAQQQQQQQQHVQSSNTNHQQIPTSSNFPQSEYDQNQQAKTNIFGPPPPPPLTTTPYPPMPTIPTATAPRFPPNANTPPLPSSSSTGFIHQQPSSPPPSLLQQSGFYSQQQNLYHPRPPAANFQPNSPYPSQVPTGPASNAAFVSQSAPPMANQQSYGVYPPQNSYYNPVQQYPQS